MNSIKYIDLLLSINYALAGRHLTDTRVLKKTPLELKDKANFFCPSFLEQFHSEVTSKFYPPAAYPVHLLLVLVKLIVPCLLFIIII